ncbi:DNA polymerase III subunit delta [Clostridium botulinum C]|uniref:DNA polymerase III subunit delta n=2 Tax=Clostridium botulinum TaxID=1491 RepID=A0A9Q4XSU7_CLOBO|nr:DNA polymerase III subunit delta [Clostridium botulinum C]NFD87956.1 DNA polymerase III subunit delta [Clostridium botulinum]MCD3200724.1 DNA polymerase III subunit delta [Clostridium botulinum C]MCD3206132.1 DNA polymerase III subunit delta [Clostridium botulinum C]MCD3208728.1 DNA polymerase III subunit delta [Clostridium botulinum C]
MGEKTLLDSFALENKLSKGEIDKFYVFCGSDEQSIRSNIDKIITKVVNKEFLELNYAQLDGMVVDMESIINACETLPLMSEKRVVVIYRANFLRDKVDKSAEKVFNALKKYIKDLPEDCVLIMYYIFENDREKESSKLKKIDKDATVVKFSKLKGMALQKRVAEIFKRKNKNITRADLALFCNTIENNMDIIENEVEKLCCYTIGRDITTKDISNVIIGKNDNDIFNLVDFVSQKKPQNSLDILNELVFKGESVTGILRMIQRQFKLIFDIKLSIEKGMNKDEISKELRLHPFICEKMMLQSKKFSISQLEKIFKLCIDTEKTLKSSSVNPKTELELLIINTVIV